MSDERKLGTINGIQYARVISAGAKYLSQREKQLDDINLFPVPDADTGTNMGGTVVLLSENPENYQVPNLSEASQKIADATIMSAKGNSGAILAQFFQGLSEGFENLNAANISQFSKAVKIAAKRSREAISNPKEGTILTVIDDWAKHLSKVDENEEDFVSKMKESLPVAEESLQKTKEQMEILRKANLVDAGAQGFVYMLEGIVDYLSHGSIQRDRWMKATKQVPDTTFQQDFDFENTAFRFCTEALLSGENINKETIQSELSSLGDSLVVIGSTKKVRVHIHTNTPGKVYELLRNHGRIIQQKIDDMEQQKRDVFSESSRDIALITDTCCDLPEEIINEYNIHRIPFGINMGPIFHYDERTITNEEFYQYMKDHDDLPKTAQLSKNDLQRMFEWTNRNYQHTIMLVISKALSGSIDNAKNTAKKISRNIYPIDSKTICIGMGLLAVQVAKAIKNGRSIDDILSMIEWEQEHMYQVFTVEHLLYLMRGGRLSKGKMFLGNLLHLKPILYVEKDGSLHQFTNAFGGSKGAQKKLMKNIIALTKDIPYLHFGICHAVDEKKAIWYKEQIEKHCNPESVIVTDMSPTIGTHSGPGTISVSWIPDFEKWEKEGLVHLHSNSSKEQIKKHSKKHHSNLSKKNRRKR